MYEGYAVGWIALALINTNRSDRRERRGRRPHIAQCKKHNGLLWGLLSLLLGPIVTFILVFL